jgi:hypothetical protein
MTNDIDIDDIITDPLIHTEVAHHHGITNRFASETRFDEEGRVQSVRFLIRYYGTQERGVGVAIVINYYQNVAQEWKCYVGHSRHSGDDYEQTLRHVCEWGSAMLEEDAIALLNAGRREPPRPEPRQPDTKGGYRS